MMKITEEKLIEKEKIMIERICDLLRDEFGDQRNPNENVLNVLNSACFVAICTGYKEEDWDAVYNIFIYQLKKTMDKFGESQKLEDTNHSTSGSGFYL